jgi:glycosyltransferase involved in cell wall biosynthesis
VGGIADQITSGEHGILVDDPADLEGFGAAVERLLGDREEAETLGRNGRRRATEEFLGDRHLAQYATVLARLLDGHSQLADKP